MHVQKTARRPARRLAPCHESGSVQASTLRDPVRCSLLPFPYRRRRIAIERRLLDLNPRLDLHCLGENINEHNVEELVSEAELIVDSAPLFEERMLLNRESQRQNKPMVEAAMYELQAQLTTLIPGQTPCLACFTPKSPPAWKRRFPVFGAVSGSVACMAAMEAIKIITGNGETLAGKLLTYDLRDMTFRTTSIQRNAECSVCGSGNGPSLGNS